MRNAQWSRTQGAYPQNLELGFWVVNQRQSYKSGKLSEDQIARLNSIGFVWSIEKSYWELRFAELIDFRDENGHCKVPQKISKYRNFEGKMLWSVITQMTPKNSVWSLTI